MRKSTAIGFTFRARAEPAPDLKEQVLGHTQHASAPIEEGEDLEHVAGLLGNLPAANGGNEVSVRVMRSKTSRFTTGLGR